MAGPGTSDPHAATLGGDAAGVVPVEPGSVLASRYEVIAVLGAGAMGTVLRVHDRELDEVVALKVLHPSIASEARALERFRQEVKLARRVTHRNVARTFELGESRGTRFITMELVDGEPLSRLMSRAGAMSVADAVPILAGICEGLAAAHAAAVVHRDIKPENVLMERTGRVVITDFGIARQHEPDDVARTQQIVGTPIYMAPEQVEGLAASPRSDLYALGVMAYEMLVGEPPWTGQSVPQIAFRRLFEPPPDPRTKRPELPSKLADAILRCMAREPADRFADASALREVLLAATSGAPTPSRPAPAAAQTSAISRTRTLAVLSFRHSATQEDAYLAEGLADDLSDALATTKGVRVVSRSAVMNEANGDPREIGKRLGLGHVVEGQFRRDGEQCRVGVRLIDVSSGFVAWAQRFELQKAQLLSAQDEIARAIASALGLETGARRAAPSDAAALDLYLRARRHYHSFAPEEARRAVSLLEEAILIAPQNATLHAGLGLALQRLVATGVGTVDMIGRLERSVAEAVRLGPELGEAHLANAQLQLNAGRPAEAARAARTAIRFSPSLPDAHELLGRLLLEAGRVPDALRRLDVAEKLDPDLAHVVNERARLAALEGDWERFEAFVRAGGDKIGGGARRLMFDTRYFMWRRDQAGLLAARTRLEAFDVDRSNVVVPAVGAILAALRGERAADQPLGLFAEGIPSIQMAVRLRQWGLQLEAEVAGYLGQSRRAARHAREAAEAGLFDLLWLERCPLLADARSEPDCIAAHERVKVTADAIVDAVWG